MNQKTETMKRTYKLIASRGNEIVLDDSVQAASPRDARKEMKKLLGLESLSGIVYSITEIPVDLIRSLVDARIAEIAGGDPLDIILPDEIKDVVIAHLTPILSRFATLDSPTTPFDPQVDLPAPDWGLIKRHYLRYGDPAKTAAKYGIELEMLETRANEEGWAS